MINLSTTTQLLSGAERFESAADFFAQFGSAFDLCRSQILKETRQTYQESGNPSYEAMASGDWNHALGILAESRKVDLDLYADLRTRGVDFIRCRPLAFPLSDYMRWEMKVFEFNAQHCERIFCCNLEAVRELFKDHIHHDFMVFDSRIGFVHDYDVDGIIQGGWRVTDLDSIIKLQSMFIFLKSHCQPFSLFKGE